MSVPKSKKLPVPFKVLLFLWPLGAAALSPFLEKGLKSLFPQGYEITHLDDRIPGCSPHKKFKITLRDSKGREHHLFSKSLVGTSADVSRVIKTTKLMGDLWVAPRVLWSSPQGFIQPFVGWGTPFHLTWFIRQLRKSHETLMRSGIQYGKDTLLHRTWRRFEELFHEDPSLKKRLEGALEFLRGVPVEHTHVVHGDLNASNLLGGLPIDWSETCLSTPFEDLGTLAESLSLSRDQENTLLQAYFGTVSPADQEALHQYRMLYRLHLGAYLMRRGLEESRLRKNALKKGRYGMPQNEKIKKALMLLSALWR